jgi:hypothetical protein
MAYRKRVCPYCKSESVHLNRPFKSVFDKPGKAFVYVCNNCLEIFILRGVERRNKKIYIWSGVKPNWRKTWLNETI